MRQLDLPGEGLRSGESADMIGGIDSVRLVTVSGVLHTVRVTVLWRRREMSTGAGSGRKGMLVVGEWGIC